MRQITDKQAEELLMMFDCIEMWGINSRGIGRLWEENKDLIDSIYEQLLKGKE
jgi:hypothetical protein